MLNTSLVLVPFLRNPLFVGRDSALLSLNEQLQHNHSVIICAPGGFGKTALALEYAYRFSAHYPCIFWLNASSRESLLADYHELSHRLDLPLQVKQQSAAANHVTAADSQNRPQIEQLDPNQSYRETDTPEQPGQSFPLTLPKWLATVRQYLLVLDDLQDSALLQEIFPASLAGHILITTRTRNLVPPQPTASLELARLDVQSGAQLLLHLSGQTFPAQTQDPASGSAFIELARKLNGQPLALTLAGSSIKAGTSFTSFLQNYHSSLNQVPAFQERPDGFSRQLVALVPPLVASLQQNAPLANAILEICAFIVPTTIPAFLFTSVGTNAATLVGSEQEQADPFYSTSIEQRQAALDLLLASRLLTCSSSKKIFSIHPLLQQVVQSSLPLEQQRRRVIQSLHLLFHLSPGCKNDPAWHLRLLAHIHHCALLSEPWTFSSGEIARTFAWAATALEQHDSFGAALFLRRKALEIWERVPGTKPTALISLRQQQFLLAQRLEYYSEAESLLHRITTDCTSFYGVEHPMTILQLVRLARVYFAQHRNEEAEVCYKKALSLSRYGRAKADQLVIAIQYELAMFYVRTGDFSSAEFLLQDVYAAFTQQLGADHPETLKRALELTVASMMIHKWGEAEALVQRVCTSYERDPATPLAETLRVWHYLALTLVAQGKWDAATITYQRIIDRIIETQGRLHPDLLPYLTEIFYLYQAQEDKQAEKQATLAWSQEIREGQLAHPQATSPRALLDNLNALGALYLSQRRFAEAERLFLRSLLLGDQLQISDPLILAVNFSALTLTEVAMGQARNQQAALYMQATITTWQHILGPDSPEVIALRAQYKQWVEEHASI